MKKVYFSILLLAIVELIVAFTLFFMQGAKNEERFLVLENQGIIMACDGLIFFISLFGIIKKGMEISRPPKDFIVICLLSFIEIAFISKGGEIAIYGETIIGGIIMVIVISTLLIEYRVEKL